MGQNWTKVLVAVALAFTVACEEQAADTPESCGLAALQPTPDFATGTCLNAQFDWTDARCQDTAWTMPTDHTLTTLHGNDYGAAHIPLPTAVTYVDDPPMSGPHRAEWPHWGEYAFLPKQRWLHGLEHGAVAILYHPCAPAELVQQLRSFAQTMPPDDGGAFRWMLTPYPNLDAPYSLVTWKNRLKGTYFDATAAKLFLAAHYREKLPTGAAMSGEDVPYDGTYACQWLGKSCGISDTDAKSSDDVGDGMTMAGMDR